MHERHQLTKTAHTEGTKHLLLLCTNFCNGKSKISLGTDFLILYYVNGCYKWYVARGDAVDFCIQWERSAVTKVRVK